MSSLFDDLQEGLQEAIDYEKGLGDAKTTRLSNAHHNGNILEEGELDKNIKMN